MRALALGLLLALGAPTIGAQGNTTARPAELQLQANITFLYYRDIPRAQRFYEDVLGLPLVVDQGYAKIYRVSRSSYVGLVDESRGLHRASRAKPVTLSFVTAQVDAWYAYLRGRGVRIIHELADGTRQPTRGFVATDPEGYYLEFETFRDDPQNARIRPALADDAVLTPAEEARTFTATFLSRYLGQFDQPSRPATYDPLDVVRPWLTPALTAALDADRVAASANPNEIVGLDFDPFVNSQDPCERYLPGESVRVGETIHVAIIAACDWAHPLLPEGVFVLVRSGSGWQLSDVRFPQGGGLLDLLRRLDAERRRPRP